ncbi:uncharacterized protein LOC117905472 [Vitis riparia]|uniref:uncharacterized protein LOC117905472 n=1 Tax=Vitis riparia TaxID=96939 RepID=UPI00155A3C83|nr:uncharacterized protein LOC117905472 [Vitis riparia]
MPALRTEREIRGFLGRLQYINRFIARLIDICKPIFRLLKKSQPTVWDDDRQRAFKKIKECLLSSPVLVPPTPGCPLFLYLSVSDIAIGCMLAQLDDLGKERAIYYLNPLRYLFDKPVLTGRLIMWLVLLTEFDIQPVDDDFPDEQFVSVTSIAGWFEELRYIHLPRAENQFADAVATLASMIEIHMRVTVQPLLIETKFALAYCCLIRDIEDQDGLPWYHDIYQFLSCGSYPESATVKDRRALRQLATRFVICGKSLYRQSPNGLLLLCLDRASADRVMREVHAGVCGPHMGGHMLAQKIMRTGYFWLTMEADYCQFVQRCPECQMHSDLIQMPPSELHSLTSSWPFSVWGIDIIGKILPKSSSRHEYILGAIDYFTKWVEVASYARLTVAKVANFIRSHIICRYGVLHELISDRGVHLRGEVDTLVQEDDI